MLKNIFISVLFIPYLYSKVECTFGITENLIFRLVNSNAITNNIKLVKDNQFHVTGETDIAIECLANVPTKILFSGVMPHEIKYTKMEWMKTENRYRLSIGFKNSPEATGSYTCVPINGTNDTLQSTIYIFADNATMPFLLHWSKGSAKNIVTIPNTEENVTIPCLTFQPDVQPKLRGRYNHSSTFYDAPEIMYRYDSTKGFIVNVTKYERYIEYECSFNTSSRLTFDMPRINCTFTPPECVNEYYEIDLKYKNISIKCESLEPFQILKNIISLKSSREQNYFYYKHFAETKLDWKHFASGYDLSCKSDESGVTLQKWSFVITAESQKEVYFNQQKNTVDCKDPSGVFNDKEKSVRLIDCRNLANCDMAERFGPWNDDDNQNLEVAENLNTDVKLGLVHCEFKKQSSDKSIVITRKYFVNLNGKPVPDMEANHDVLRISLPDSTKSVYLGQYIKLTCEASIFIFAEGLEFRIVLRNGSYYQNMGNPDQSIEINKVKITQTIKISSENITAVECHALKWSENEWVKVSEEIEVKVGEMPFIDSDPVSSDKELVKIEFDKNEKLKNIRCEAKGIPLPSIRWNRLDREGNILKNTFSTHDENLTTHVISTLKFPNVLHEIYYIYSCIANNSVGETNRTFLIEMIKNDTGIQPWIVYTTVAVVLLLSVTVILVLCRMLRTKQNQIELSESEILTFLNGDQDLVHKYQELHEVAQYLPYKQQYEIHSSKIEIKNDILGTGQCGLVVKGLLQKAGIQIPVAVKTVKSGSDISHLRALLSEIKIMMYIGNHPHIIELLGAMTKDLREGKLHVAIEFCSNGNMQNFLRNSRPVFVDQIFNDEIVDLDLNLTEPVKSARSSRWLFGIDDVITSALEKRRTKYFGTLTQIKTTNLVTWCYQVASGMEYLSDKKVIHGDLASRNLLLTDALSVKITDFGLARHLYDYTNYVTKQKNEALPWRWLSIEAIKDCKFSTASDVWAFGVCLWEIFSLGEIPYQGFSWGEEFVQRLSGGYRMGKPNYATDDIYNTMMECWNTAPRDRPSFEDILKNFKELLERVGNWSEEMNATTSKSEKFSPPCLIPEILIFDPV